ncbi:hypothetical protein Hanom_Chr12g01114621 [Helianthus anomalus]
MFGSRMSMVVELTATKPVRSDGADDNNNNGITHTKSPLNVSQYLLIFGFLAFFCGSQLHVSLFIPICVNKIESANKLIWNLMI